MKILILAAGRGTRIQSTQEFVPKPLINFHDMPLFYWSFKSFQSWISQGIISKSDIVFVIDKADSEKYGLAKSINDHFKNQVLVIELVKRTSSSVESAFAGLSELRKKILLDENETLVISDCDHYFNASEILRYGDLKVNENEVQIVLAKKNAKDLSWCFPVRNEKDYIVEIREKPRTSELEGIDTSYGCVGVYIFPSQSHFFNITQTLVKDISSELYISAILNKYISLNYFVEARSIDFFIPLGTIEQLDTAAKLIPSNFFIHDKPTIFIDLDGTLIFHNSGLDLDGKSIGKVVPIDTDIFAKLTKFQQTGGKVIVTTARPAYSNTSLMSQIESFNFKPDQIIFGLTGGQRLLVNDIKPTAPHIRSALSMNIARNSGDFVIPEELNYPTFMLSDLSSESGESTYLVSKNMQKTVIKISNSSDHSKDLIRYQIRWFLFIQEILPNNTPNIINFVVDSYQTSIETEYLIDLVPIHAKLISASAIEKKIILYEFTKILEKIYSYTISDEQNICSILVRILEEKAIPGYLKALSYFKFDSQKKFLDLTINPDRKISNRLNDFNQVLSNLKDIHNYSTEEFYYPTALIHGDPTFSNISYANGKIILLDPIGSRIDPQFLDNDLNLGRSPIEFDISRIRLSLLDKYEFWDENIILEKSNRSLLIYSSIDNCENLNWDEFCSIFPENFRGKDKKINLLIHLTTLSRILPYKLKNKEKEAAYILTLIDYYFDMLIQENWDLFK
jgi:NDP-sugar pyrophosphorylase family protein